jgi:beta-lactamase superfamily II metal-dependent hydrolase
MYLEIFDVEHGACALLTTSNGKRILIDAGHNGDSGWRPGTFLLWAGIPHIDKLIVSNYDEDHVSGYPNLSDNVSIGALVRNPSVPPTALRLLKSKDGMGAGINRLVYEIEHVFTGGARGFEDLGDASLTYFWNRYAALPVQGYFTDENNLSLVTFVKCGSHKFIFPGDIEKAGWLQLLHDPAFVAELWGITAFVASHHGRENGYCEEVLKLCPNITAFIISDKKMGYQSQEIVDWYRPYASGFDYNGNRRHVLTTRRDGNMQFSIPVFGSMANVWLGLAA